ncbi:CheY-like superfamily [Stachybotrys elegans]|uniref:CheY-like superfamily n=1 Tax=Stachybotrys elegans TaxID=80388 RepID=A0A8K0WIA7_9HYPO|nr:CheY-like superfamily [Stachybotrys elegans]
MHSTISPSLASSTPKPQPHPPQLLGGDGSRPPSLDVLIVEDNVVNQKVLQRQLRQLGNNTYLASHGGEALEILRRSRLWSAQEVSSFNLSIILMDLEMPVMDGATCACRIRELERNGSIIPIPIIATTAHNRLDQINNAKAAGIDDVVHKPIRISELIPKIEQLIIKYREVQLQVHSHRAASGQRNQLC